MSLFQELCVRLTSAIFLLFLGCDHSPATMKSGPATQYGNLIDVDKLATFVQGETTYAQVIKILGQPVHIADNGNRLLIYRAAPDGDAFFIAIFKSSRLEDSRLNYVCGVSSKSLVFGVITQQQLNEVHVGMTFAQLLAKLGPPLRHSGSGTEILHYLLNSGEEVGFTLTGAAYDSQVIWVPPV